MKKPAGLVAGGLVWNLIFAAASSGHDHPPAWKLHDDGDDDRAGGWSALMFSLTAAPACVNLCGRLGPGVATKQFNQLLIQAIPHIKPLGSACHVSNLYIDART